MSFRRIAEIVVIAATTTASPAFCQDADVSSNEPIRTISAVVESDAKAAISGINTFSLDLYRRTLTADENHFLSPASVSVAIGLAYRGARGTTAGELEKTFHFTKPPWDYLRANGQVLDTMTFSGPRRELRTANAVWLQDEMPLLPEYEKDVTAFAQAGLQRVNFRGEANAARIQINSWVAESTRGKIKDLLLPDDITKRTRAILVNAIYWKGAWAGAFDKKQTKTEPFTQLSGDQVSTPLMRQQSNFRLIERGGFKAISLPYVGHEVEMVVFLPNSAKGLPKFEEELTAADLANWLTDLANAERRETILTIPKMHVELRQDLKNSLISMGAPTAFSDDADFSGMATIPYPGEVPEAVGLKIARVIHKTYLDVDEVGAEAAAATAVGDIVVSSARREPPPPPFIFRADKPFFFLLRDLRTGLILFMGRYVKTQAERPLGD